MPFLIFVLSAAFAFELGLAGILIYRAARLRQRPATPVLPPSGGQDSPKPPYGLDSDGLMDVWHGLDSEEPKLPPCIVTPATAMGLHPDLRRPIEHKTIGSDPEPEPRIRHLGKIEQDEETKAFHAVRRAIKESSI